MDNRNDSVGREYHARATAPLFEDIGNVRTTLSSLFCL